MEFTMSLSTPESYSMDGLFTMRLATGVFANDNTTVETSTHNATETPPPRAPPRWWLLAPLLALQLLTIAANVAVMFCVRTYRRLKNVFGIYIFSLAWADFAVGLLVMGGMTIYSIPDYWPIGFDTCSLWIAVDYPCCTVSMLHLCVIARDRYLALSRPLDYKNLATTRNAVVHCLLSWVCGFALWVPTVMYVRETERDVLDAMDCYFTSTRPDIIMVQAAVVYYTPVFVMSYYYIMCVVLLRRRMAVTAVLGTYERNLSGAHATTSGSVSLTHTTQTTHITAISQSTTVSDRSKAEGPGVNRQEQQLRGIRTLGVVIFMFLFCWAPFCAFWPLVAYCPEGCIPLPLYIYSYWMTYVNSTINPLLYFLVNKDFRAGFKRLVCPSKRKTVAPMKSTG